MVLMSDTLAYALVLAPVSFGLGMTMFDLLGASIYDIKDIRRQVRFARKKRRAKLPRISVIIPAFNEEVVIERCLQSIIQSTYTNYEVIVSDDCSKDKTRKLVREFIKSHPKKNLYLHPKRKNTGRGGAINAGYKKYATGDLIMAIDADCTLEPDTLKRAAQHFIADESLSALASNIRIMKHPSIIGLLQQFEYMTGFRAKKAFTTANAEYLVGGAGAVYRREIFDQLKGFNEHMLTEDIALSLSIAQLGNIAHRLKYGSDVIVYTEPVLTYHALFKQRFRWKLGSLQALFHHKQLFFAPNRKYSKLLSWFRLPLVIWSESMLLLEPLVFGYFLYLALSAHEPRMFMVGWGALCLMIQFAIWGDEHLKLRQKLRFTLLTPIMYPLYNVMALIQIAAAFKCLLNYKRITGKKQAHGLWQPPARMTTN